MNHKAIELAFRPFADGEAQVPAASEVSLPIQPYLTEEEMDRVAGASNE